jgi:hypothetical protein
MIEEVEKIKKTEKQKKEYINR